MINYLLAIILTYFMINLSLLFLTILHRGVPSSKDIIRILLFGYIIGIFALFYRR